jgi:hypothetical protein
MSVGRKKNRLTRQDFVRLFEHSGLTRKQADTSLTRLDELKSAAERLIQESLLKVSLKKRFLEIFRERMARIL